VINSIDARLLVVLALLGGLAAVVVAMLAGVAPGLLQLVAQPPPIARAALAGGSIVVGGRLLLSAVRRINESMQQGAGPATRISDADLGSMVRGVRLVFLAAAAFTAKSGYPRVLGCVIVMPGVDVVSAAAMLVAEATP